MNPLSDDRTICSAAELLDRLLNEREQRVREEIGRKVEDEWLRGVRSARTNIDNGLERVQKTLVKHGHEKVAKFLAVIVDLRHEIENRQLGKKQIGQILEAAKHVLS